MELLFKLVALHPEAFEASALPCCLRGLLGIDAPAVRDSRPGLSLVRHARGRDRSPCGPLRSRKALD